MVLAEVLSYERNLELIGNVFFGVVERKRLCVVDRREVPGALGHDGQRRINFHPSLDDQRLRGLNAYRHLRLVIFSVEDVTVVAFFQAH